MKLYELGWSMTIQNTQEARELGYLQRVAMRHEYAKETRLYNLVPVLKADYASRAQRYNKTMRGVRNKQLIGVLPMNLLFLLSNAGIFIYAALQAGKGELSAGSLVLVVTSLTQLHQTLTATTEYLGLITEHLLWYKKYYDFLDAQPKVRPAPQPLPCPQRLDIFLENVTFGYSGQPPIFEGLNLTLPEGQIVAIVGENGAGKSSLVKLLLRFYDPTAGRILIGPDKIDLRQLDIQAWRSQFAAVFQDFSRFEWTISQNIVLAAPRDEQRLAQVLRSSGLEATVNRLPSGLQTRLGQAFGGVDLSGGQWQKLAMARAFYRGARILVLDEPTAALDPRSEAEVFRQFAELAKGRTALMVTHRLGSVVMADRILVLRGGRIAEDGTHEELLALGGEYAELWHLQAQQYGAALPIAT